MGEVFDFSTGRNITDKEPSEEAQAFEMTRVDLKNRLMELSDVLVATPSNFPDKRLLTDVVAGLGILLNPENLENRLSRFRAAATELSNAAAETRNEYDRMRSETAEGV